MTDATQSGRRQPARACLIDGGSGSWSDTLSVGLTGRIDDDRDSGAWSLRLIRLMRRWINGSSVVAFRQAGCGEGLQRPRGEAAGAKLGTASIEWSPVNVGTVRYSSCPVCQGGCGIGTSSVEGAGSRIRRRAPRPGKPVTWEGRQQVRPAEGLSHAGRSRVNISAPRSPV